MTTARLLSADQVAQKIGYAVGTFRKRAKRQALERAGFPAPCLTSDAFGSNRWDERAIDLWLDGRMPQRLRNQLREQEAVQVDGGPQDWNALLERRAQELRP